MTWGCNVNGALGRKEPELLGHSRDRRVVNPAEMVVADNFVDGGGDSPTQVSCGWGHTAVVT